MVGFYKHDIPAWMDGTEALSDGAYRVYHVVVQLIMLNEGPIARNDRGIAGRCNQTVKAFGRYLDELISIGKLTFEGDRIGAGSAAITGIKEWRREPIASALRQQILERDQFACVYCGSADGPFEIDHVHPHSRGGFTDARNLATACFGCNRDKGARTVEEWVQ